MRPHSDRVRPFCGRKKHMFQSRINGRFRPVLHILLTLNVVYCAAAAWAGDIQDDFDLILSSKEPAEGTEKTPVFANESSELALVAKGLIRLYQLTVSSGDLPLCNFEPSCSRFAAASIERYGLFKGILSAADRIQRCHLWSNRYGRGEFAIYGQGAYGRLLDRPEQYDFKNDR